MNKKNVLIVLFLSLFLSGCIKIGGGVKNKTSEKSDIENMNFESIDSAYSSMEGTYLDYVDIASICQKFKGEISIDNKAKVKKYTEITRSILTNINSALDCKVSIPVTIVDHESYMAIAREDGVYLTRGVFDSSDYIDEIAFIIYHESVHYLLEHPKTMILKAASLKDEKKRANEEFNSKKSQNFLTGLLGSTSNFITDNYSRTMEIEETRAKNGLSTKHETHADLVGVDLLVKAGYSPQALSHNLDNIRSCLGYQEGDLNSAFNSLNEQAKEMNKNGGLSSYSDRLDFFDSMNNISGDHSPIPWREKMIFTYIKNKHSGALRNEMIENI
ncbi:M48 family metalloprotease [Marinomonas atlantica]|uniref:M48 family metalloprotease n=1 Tax=Marinomonas atlantica TaxID=1806668 RepID=UPI000832E0A6|nr:M48 family metalloprotease [Marinomonas atlantica]